MLTTRTAYFNGTGEYKALNLYLEEAGSDAAGVYGLGVEQIKDGVSTAKSVFADYGFQEFEWKVDENGVISHKLTAALNRFYGMFSFDGLLESCADVS